jgi:hypothetical protein
MGLGSIQFYEYMICLLFRQHLSLFSFFQFTLERTHYMKHSNYCGSVSFSSYNWRRETAHWEKSETGWENARFFIFFVSILIVLPIHPQEFRTVVFTQTKKVQLNSRPILTESNDGTMKRWSPHSHVTLQPTVFLTMAEKCKCRLWSWSTLGWRCEMTPTVSTSTATLSASPLAILGRISAGQLAAIILSLWFRNTNAFHN